MEYNFPFTTCEKPLSGSFVAQPVSAAINFFGCACLIGILLFEKKPLTTPTVFFILSLIAFNLAHAFSHTYHIKGRIQSRVIHAFTYIIAFMILLVVYTKTGSVNIALVSLAVTIDIFMLIYDYTTLSVISGIFIVVATIIGNIDVFPTEYLMILFPVTLIGIAYFLIELRFCDAAMKIAVLPYHAIGEIITLIFLIIFAKMIISLE